LTDCGIITIPYITFYKNKVLNSGFRVQFADTLWSDPFIFAHVMIFSIMKTNNLITHLVAASDIGLQRKRNEDNFLIGRDLARSDSINEPGFFHPAEGSVMAVADGMGGVNAGDIASSLAVASVLEYFMNLPSFTPDNENEIKKLMFGSMDDAAFEIRNHARVNPETKDMGTTLTLAWILCKKAYICWCGDSRAYFFVKIRGSAGLLPIITGFRCLLMKVLSQNQKL